MELRRPAISVLFAAVAGIAQAAPALEPKPQPPIPDNVHAILKSYCLDCHTGEEPSAGIDLGSARNSLEIYQQARTWNTAVRVLRDRQMPPQDESQPDDVQRELLARWIEDTIRSTDCRQDADPGRVTVRRLNRIEYDNTIHDLFGIEIAASKDLPSDPAGNGFDNQGDTLFMPPVLMEKYLDATKRIVNLVFAEPTSRAKLMLAEPSETISAEECARINLTAFVPRAFRRPAEPEEIESRVAIAVAAVERGESFDTAMKTAVEATLLSPHFLFRVEQDRESAEPYRISDHELASRLSYFLWASMPDRELMDFADSGKLSEPAVLRVQVERLLNNPRATSLAEHFAGQWLGFRDMRKVEMDSRRFGGFNGVRNDMFWESMGFFDELFRYNGSLLDILDCDYSFLNENLARHYGVSGVKGGEIRKVLLSDRRRGGVLGMGSTLVVTSYPTRTSPVLRGKWILEQLLGTPPPPPPPNVKPISKDDQAKDGLTLRQRFELHRSDATCASCHARMDPLGFSLENFDGIGQWREKDNGFDIDNSGVLPDGTTFQGPQGLKDALLARKELFLRQVVERMFVYALGRPVEYYDECAVRGAMDRLEQNGFRSHELVHAIVESFPFQYRRNAE